MGEMVQFHLYWLGAHFGMNPFQILLLLAASLLQKVPIAGEVISRRPKGAASRAHHKAGLAVAPKIG